MNGKQIRMKRITEKGKAVIIPMDHGTTDGPIKGLENMNRTVPMMVAGGATAVLMHKGIIKNLCEPPACGMIMHMSASTKLAIDPNHKVQVASVNEAVRLGVDAVSVHVNIGGNGAETEMLKTLGSVSDECDAMQMPLLAMIYPRGKNVREKLDPEAVALAARLGGELGADIIKTVYTGDASTFKKVVEGCPVPIVIAGGPKCENERDVLEMVQGAMDAGAIGVSLGRNAFQHENPAAMVRALRAIIIDNASIEETLEKMGEST
ncbi:MAG: 2-amino-3,7-dideoxy-D-threo-hept-6-ulosonate synthase [Candidatus Methanofastidiosia archaeon]